jgi:hypothetical protein
VQLVAMEKQNNRTKLTTHLKTLVNSLFRKESEPPPQMHLPGTSINIEPPVDIKTQITELTIEKEIADTALQLIKRAQDKNILSEDEKQHLTTKYQKILIDLEQLLFKKKRYLELQQLQETKRNIEESYMKRIKQIEEYIKIVSKQLLEEKAEKSRLTTTKSPTKLKNTSRNEFKDLKNEIQIALEKLEQIEVEN